MERNFTTIDNNYIKGNNTLSPNELTILTVISMNKTVKNQYIFTLKHLLNLLGATNNPTRKIKEIKQILISLEKENILEYYNATIEKDKTKLNISKTDKNDLIFATNNILLSEGFTQIYDDEIIKILNLQEVNTNELLTLYIYILSFINFNQQSEDYKLCFVSHENIMDNLGLAKSTIIKYIKLLTDNNLLRCDYAGFKTTNGFKNETMYYCRAEDEKLLIERLNNIRKDKSITPLTSKNKNILNLKRSIKQKINRLKKKEEDNIITNIEIEKLKQLKEEYKTLKIER